MADFESNLNFALRLLKKGKLSEGKLINLASSSGTPKRFYNLFIKKACEWGLKEDAEKLVKMRNLPEKLRREQLAKKREQLARKRLEERGVVVPEGRNAVRFEKKMNVVDEYKSFVAATLESGMEFEKAVELAKLMYNDKKYKRYVEKRKIPYYLKEALRISFTPKLPSGEKRKKRRR